MISPISPVCLTCGTMKKSGKLSCCGRGGSWFGSCGVAGNTKLQHTWHEGIQACETRQHKTGMEQQGDALHQNSNKYYNDDGGAINSKAVIMDVQILVFTSTSVHNNTSIQTPIATANRPITGMSESNAVHDRKSDSTSSACETDITSSKVITTAATRRHIQFTEMQTILSINQSNTILAKAAIDPPARSTIPKADHMSMRRVFTDVASFYKSISASVIAHRREIIARVGLLFIIVVC